MPRHAMIMAGGAGTRLWPLSREDRPKQLLPLVHGRSLLEVAATRLEGLVPAGRRWICTAERHRSTIRADLPEFDDEHILGEPEGRDTVNAVGLTAAVLAARDPDAVFAVLTADHIIEPEDEFRRAVGLGFELVEDDASRFVTFAITPTFAATGFGYVERGEEIRGFTGGYAVTSFIEKPDPPTARRLVSSSRYAWNSGMFVFHAGRFLDALGWFVPESRAGLGVIADAWPTTERRAVLDREYPRLPRTSVDYGVMEPAARNARIEVCCVPMDVRWTDVGSWTSYATTLAADGNGCRTNGRAVHLESRNVLAVSDDPEHLVTTIGCEDLIIVRTADITLVCPASRAQDVKRLVERIEPELR